MKISRWEGRGCVGEEEVGDDGVVVPEEEDLEDERRILTKGRRLEGG